MPTLLGIPCELRLLIIEATLNSVRDAPTKPSKQGREKYRGEGLENLFVQDVWIEQPQADTATNCLPLLLVNHQISAETRRILRVMSPTTYMLDMSVLNEFEVFPTWLSIPRLTDRLTTLHVDVRLFGHIRDYKDSSAGAGQAFNVAIHWGFQLFLARFFLYGPYEQTSGSEFKMLWFARTQSRDITANTLILNFCSAEEGFDFPPEDVSYHDWHDHQLGAPLLDAEEAAAWKTPSEWFARWTMAQMRYFGHLSWIIPQGLILCHVGTVVVYVEGVFVEVFEIARELENFEAGEEIAGERVRLGLPVPVESSDEDETSSSGSSESSDESEFEGLEIEGPIGSQE